jgi:drug/metabolite transporter (DMT)-like permease
MDKQQEKTGVIFAFISAIMWGMFPVLVNRGTQNIPPIMFAGITTLLAATGSLIYVILKGKLYELKNRKAYGSLLMVTLCIVIFPYILFFIGSSKTSGINSSLLLLSEIIFTMLFTPFIGEKTTSQKIIGASGIFIGASLILYNGTFSFNIGDILIILSTITYPIGNFYAKKALNHVSPSIILLVRFLLGGLFILAFALFTESQLNITQTISQNWPIILFTGLVLLGVGKVIWYEGLKRLDIAKAISLGMTFPLFSLIILIVFFQEIPSTYQWIGITIMALGIYFSVKRKSTDPTLTKYAG